MTSRITYFFVGGGTGGHLYPGIAIAERLVEADGAARCVFLCSERAVDRAVMSATGFEFAALPARPAGASVRGVWGFVRSWGPSVRAARARYRAAKAEGEVRVIAMGGFVAAPAVRAAHAEGVEVTLVNLDAVPGKANRLIARRAARVFTALPVDVRHGYANGWTLTAPIVRRGARSGLSGGECRSALGLDAARPVLMVTGGSLGAASLNELMIAQMNMKPERSALQRALAGGGWQVLHQCGGSSEAVVEKLRSAYLAAGVPAIVEVLVQRMDLWWGSAEVAVSRAGAGAVAEAWGNGVPTIFAPYPYHKDQHQRENAARLVKAGGAVVAEDLVEPERNAETLGRAIVDLITDGPRRTGMRGSLKNLGPANGAETIAQELRNSRGSPNF
ncbi:undecaprenyldiphospho-muramoylpentapeptide beta-N-acetylglucosaminyltransferase [soil metagenome]